MPTPEQSLRPRSVYGHSAQLGLPMGLYLFLMSAALLGSIRFQPLILFIFPLALGLPVVLYFLIHRVWKQDPMLHTFGAVWLLGIWIFIFGSLVCAILSAGWIFLFEPDFVSGYLSMSIDAISNSPMAEQYASQLEQFEALRRSGSLPTPMEFIFTMIWSTAFLGSIISLLIAFVFKAKEFKS